MTTPNMDLKMVMPQTALFTGKEGGAQWLTTLDGRDFVYLPRGTSMVQIVATGLQGVRLRPNSETGATGRITLTDVTPGRYTERIYTDTFTTAWTGNAGMWIKIWCIGLTAEQAKTGTVGVTITPMQVE